MTGGVVVVLGADRAQLRGRHERRRGLRLRPRRRRSARAATWLVELERVDEDDGLAGHGLIDDHVRHTGSPLGRRLLDNWD
jgi:glutamate synthase (NADPH/NADH) large chain